MGVGILVCVGELYDFILFSLPPSLPHSLSLPPRSHSLHSIISFLSLLSLQLSPRSGIPAPASTRLTVDDVYDKSGKPQPEVLKAHFIREGRLEESVAMRIINECEC